MNTTGEKLLAFYRQAIRLYPQPFQETYAEELTAVFALQLQAQEAAGTLPLIKTALCELRDLPPSILAAFLRERRRHKMKLSLNHWFSNNTGSERELLLAALPFLLIGFIPGLLSSIPAIQNLPQMVGGIILGTLFLVLAALGVIGLLVELPRWSLTYAGISLTLLALSTIISPNLWGGLPLPANWPVWSLNALLFGAFLIALALSTGIVLWAARHIQIMKPFANNIRNDRSLLSFMMFAGAYVLVVAHYEDLPESGFYLIGSSLMMVAGAWVYLRAEKLSAKLWALVVANLLGNAITLAANLTLFPSPVWKIEFAGLQFPATVMFVLLTWLTSLTMILAPLVLIRQSARPNEVPA